MASIFPGFPNTKPEPAKPALLGRGRLAFLGRLKVLHPIHLSTRVLARLRQLSRLLLVLIGISLCVAFFFIKRINQPTIVSEALGNPIASLKSGSVDPLHLVQSSDVELRLSKIYELIHNNQLNDAQFTVEKLEQDYPNLPVAHMIRGDLLMAKAHALRTIGLGAGQPEERLADLRAEFKARLLAIQQAPNKEVVPAMVMRLAEQQKTVLLVDASRNRMYVYEKKQDVLHYVADYYVSIGKLGTEKSREGDQKTPLGVYEITQSLPSEKLPEFYGKAAMALNYPNEWDALHGKTGHGIWIHGVPSPMYARPPLASDGCLVMSNQDVEAITHMVVPGVTQVVITDHIDWSDVSANSKTEAEISQSLKTWHKDRVQKKWEDFRQHYSSQFAMPSIKPETLNETLKARLEQANPGTQISNLSILGSPQGKGMVVTTFDLTQTANNQTHTEKYRLYWQKERGNAWKIVYEGVVPIPAELTL